MRHRAGLRRLYGLTLASVFLGSCSNGGTQLAPNSVFSVSQSVPPFERTPVWDVISSPNSPPGTDGIYDDLLYGISGTASDDVWAVGRDCCVAYGSQEYNNSLIEHWDGSGWTIVPSASNQPADTELRGVAAVSRRDVWAVGYSTFPNQALVEHWDGKRWKAVSTPFEPDGQLLSVVGLARNNVWAVGQGNGNALIEHWDGKAWSVVNNSSGSNPSALTTLWSVSASGPNDIWAVGEYDNPNPNVFAEHWNGVQWRSIPPSNSFFASRFSGVASVSANDVWAVGYQRPSQSSQVPQTLVEQWNGTKWSVIHSPNRDPKDSYLSPNWLFSVVARSASDAWAVGYWTYYPGSGTVRSLFEHWNGKHWRLAQGPAALESDNNSAANQLLSIAIISRRLIWGAGYQEVPGACCDQTLTVRTTHG
jgi:hypothetical protein